MDLFQVAAKLVLEKGDFDKGISDANASGKNLAENLSGYMDKAKKIVTGLFTVAAIKKAASAVWSLANSTAQAGDRIDKQSQSLGLSRKAYQEWDYILSQNGASIDSMAISMKTLNSAIAANSGEVAAGLADIGLSAAYLQSISPEQQFEEVVRALQKMPAGAEKTRIAMLLLGKNAQALMPLLNQTAESTEELRQRAHELGLIMSDEDVDASVAFGDALDDLNKVWTALKMKFGAQMLPMFTTGIISAANALGRITTAVQDAFKTGDWSTVFNTITNEIKTGIPGVINTIVDMAVGLVTNADQVIGLGLSLITGLSEGLVAAAPVLAAKIPEIVSTLVESALEVARNLGNSIIGVLNETFGTEIPEIDLSFISDGMQWFVDNKESVVSAVTAIIGAFVATNIGTFITTINPLSGIFALIAGAIALVAANWDEISGWIGQAWTTTVEWVQEKWDDVSNAFSEAEEWVDNVWTTTVEWAQNKWSDISNAFTEAGKWVSDNAHTIAVSWQSTVDDWFEKVNNWLASTEIGSATLNFLDNVTDWYTRVWDWLASVDIGSATLNFLANVPQWFKTIKEWLSNKSNEIQTDINTTVDSWITTIGSWFDGTGITSFTMSIGATVSEWIQRIYDWIQNGINVVVSFFSGGGPSVTPSSRITLPDGTKIPDPMGVYKDFGGLGGGFAKGLNYVPFDGLALLHRGETVLNQAQGREWREGNNGTFDTQEIYQAVASAVAAAVEKIQINMDGTAVGNAVSQQVSRNIYQAQIGRRFAVL